MNDRQYLKWFIEVANQEYSGNLNFLKYED